MKKIILLCLFLLANPAFSLEEMESVGIAKYAVLEVLHNNTPLRSETNENAKRVTHLYKNTILFADKQTKNYYRVELKENNYVWVNKKNVEVQAIIPEKRISNINSISFKNKKNLYKVEIESDMNTAYEFKENKTDLELVLYDNRFDSIETNINGKNRVFSYDDKIQNDFNLKYVNDRNLFGYSLDKNEDASYVLTIKKAPKINPKRPLSDLVVVVDAGHGGREKGVCAFNLEEKTINLQISKKLKRELSKKGAKVYMTRKKDKEVPLYDRTSFAKEKNADILLSIHQNSLPDIKKVNQKHGTSVYYYNKQAKPLAEKIQKNMLEMTNFKDDKVNHASFAVIRPTSQIGVIVECGYLIHNEEAKKLSDKSFQKVVAKAIVKGCEEYMKENFNAKRN